MRIMVLVAVLMGLPALARAQEAELRKSGGQAWPGKLQIGLRPVGGQVFLADQAIGVFTANADVAGLIKDTVAASLWLGGELTIGGRENLAAILPGVFLRVSFERHLKVPLVPYIQAGLVGGAYVIYGDSFNAATGIVGGRVGGGFDYYLTRNVALGVQTGFLLAAAISNGASGARAGFAGSWEIVGGVRLAL
jgi:hypothetical protein